MKGSFRKLYVDELKDLFSAEKQLIKALPKMAKASSSEDLRNGFEEHLEQTKVQVQRLEEIFATLDEKSGGKKCVGMEGIIQEGAEVIDGDFTDEVKDSALISAAQRVEHYEIAAYGTVVAYAELLGESVHAGLLRQTLDEEKETNQKLTELSTQINQAAEQESPEGETETKNTRRGRAA